MLDTLVRLIVPAVAGHARLVPLAALADSDLSVRALRAAAERGRLKAQRDERGSVAKHPELGGELPGQSPQESAIASNAGRRRDSLWAD